MNIHGYKQKIEAAKEEMAKDIGTKRFQYYERQIRSWKNCIKKLREKHKKKQ
jgi:hypothetical protein